MRLKGTMLSVPILVFLFICVARVFVKNQTTPEKTTTDTFIGYYSLAPIKHATRSLAELRMLDKLSGHILFFNRIPKSGSELLLLLIQWLQGWNNFRHVRLKDNNKPRLSKIEQAELVERIQDRIKQEAIPLCFDGPTHFINFSSFDRQSPTFINLIRDPVDNFVARYQFKKTTANPLDHYFTATVENNVPIEKCIKSQNLECNFEENQPYDFSIPYFCGQDVRCMLHNNLWALEQAKSNVEKYFPAVGILEEVNVTLKVFEKSLPFFFRGVQKIYYKDLLEPYHIDGQKRKLRITTFARKYLRNQLTTEYEFYQWIRRRLFQQLSTT